jgi:hypothetical protein
MNDQVLQDALRADAGFELGVFSLGGRCFADIGCGKSELAEREIPHIGLGDGGIAIGLAGIGGFGNRAGGG